MDSNQHGSDAVDLAGVICPSCGRELAPGAEHCAACGTAATARLTIKKDQGSRDARAMHSKWYVLGVLFLATGALGLPILFKSKAFSKPLKVVLTILVIVYTMAMLWLTYAVISWFVGQMKAVSG